MKQHTILYIVVFLFFKVSAHAQSEAGKHTLQSVAVSLGHHSIGWPLAFRTPLHLNSQVDLNWNIYKAKPSRQFTTSLGYTQRNAYTDDFYLLATFNSVRNIGKEKFYYALRVGVGAFMSVHKQQIYEFNNGEYVKKKLNNHFSGLIVLGFESGYHIKDNLKLGLSYDWRIQIPHGGGLPFLPHSHYNLKLIHLLK